MWLLAGGDCKRLLLFFIFCVFLLELTIFNINSWAIKVQTTVDALSTGGYHKIRRTFIGNVCVHATCLVGMKRLGGPNGKRRLKQRMPADKKKARDSNTNRKKETEQKRGRTKRADERRHIIRAFGHGLLQYEFANYGLNSFLVLQT